MYLSPERAGAMLAPKTQSWSYGIGIDPERLTPEDVAALAAGMDPWAWQAWALVRREDVDGVEHLERELFLRTVDLRVRGKWRMPRDSVGQEMLRKLARMALEEEAVPRLYREEYKTEADKARALNRAECNWYAVWRPRYRAVRGVLLGLVAEGDEWMADGRGWRRRAVLGPRNSDATVAAN